MRKRKVLLNAMAGVMLQSLMIIYGFVFPRLVMSVYGSSVNGVLQSVSQFLGYIALLDAGVSAVIRAKFYKPLADGDTYHTQRIINAAKRFYERVAIIFVFYAIVVAVVLPCTVLDEFNYFFTFSLVVIIAASTFAEYFFGISFQVLLEADQRKYIVYVVQSIVVLINTIFSVILIKMGVSIHIVKLTTSALFIARPLFISMYCKKRYKFVSSNKEIEEIPNKWAGMGHHIAYFLHSHTDVVLLTFAKGPLIVSVYSVYNMIVTGLRQVLSYLTGGIEAAFGNMIAKNENENIKTGLELYEILVFSCGTVAFTTAAVTILDFVNVYTKGITDVNYIEPVAAVVLILAEMMYCIRRPYEALVMAAGKLKETMNGAFIEAALNMAISLTLVWKYSITGVAIGTLFAVTFRTVQYVCFVSKTIVKCKPRMFFVKFFIYICIGIVLYFSSKKIDRFTSESYLQWAVKAVAVTGISGVIVFAVDMLMFRTKTVLLWKTLVNALRRKKTR